MFFGVQEGRKAPPSESGNKTGIYTISSAQRFQRPDAWKGSVFPSSHTPADRTPIHPELGEAVVRAFSERASLHPSQLITRHCIQEAVFQTHVPSFLLLFQFWVVFLKTSIQHLMIVIIINIQTDRFSVQTFNKFSLFYDKFLFKKTTEEFQFLSHKMTA